MIVHEQLLVFLQNGFGHALGDFDNHLVLTLAPGLAEPGTDGFTAENFEPAFAALVFMELAQQGFLAQGFQVGLFIGVRSLILTTPVR